MADEINGGGRTVEITGNEDLFVDFDDSEPKAASVLMQKMEALERENRELIHDKETLKEEIQGLKGEIQRSESDKKALESIAARAAQLETEVSRLQHDLITAETQGYEASKEVSELKVVVEELKKSDADKGLKLEAFEKERNLLLERIERDGEGMKEAKAVTESRVGELEKKLEGLEGRESVEKSERIKVEQEAKAKIDEKENEIRELKKWVENLDLVVAKSNLEMERMNKEREELEIVKNELEGLLKKSERKGKEMEHKMSQLHKELEASEQMISGLKDKTLIKGINGMDKVGIEDGDSGFMGSKLQWPVLAASTGAIATMGILYYLHYARRR